MNNFSNYDPNQMMLENFNSSGSNNQGSQNQNMPFNNPHIASIGNLNNMSSIPNFSQGEIMNMSNNIDSLSTSGYLGNNQMGTSYPLNNNMYGSQTYSSSSQLDLNGTNLNELSSGKEDNSSLIKSLTKEIISNLKESNLDLTDSKSRSEDSESESSSKKKKKKKHNNIKEDLQEYMEEQNPVPSTNKYLSMIFSDSFNVKDFLLLFTLYFLLSQNMIKDFFARYFNCLNPDEDGKIHVQGVIVYGLILTILFMLLKKII